MNKCYNIIRRLIMSLLGTIIYIIFMLAIGGIIIYLIWTEDY